MSQCVPSWDLDESNNSSRIPFQADPNTNSAAAPEDAMLDYEVAELTWENGQLSMHGLGLPRPAVKPLTTSGKCPWDKPRVGGTLESIVDQATSLPPPTGDELVPWFAHHRAAPVATAIDAIDPCSKRRSSGQESSTHVPDPDPSRQGFSKRMVESSTRVGSCSVAAKDETAAAAAAARKRMKVAGEGSSREQSASRQVTMDTCEMDLDAGFTSSLGSHEHTSRGQPLSSRTKPTTVDDHDSVCHSRPQREAGSGDEKNGKMGRSSISTKRSRAAAIHNQSERKRRDRINQRMKTLQKLVPNSSKTDKASMLDEVIEYLKQLQAQIQMMSKMSSIPHMMMPMAMQQIQMSMMAQMGMGMGMGMGVMDLSSINRTGHHATTPVPPMLHPAAFLPLTAAAWDGSGDRLQPAAGVMPDPFSTAFLACQTQPMNLDAYNRMAALYQQLQQSSGLTPPNSKT